MGYNISPLRQQLFGTLLVLGNILSSAFSGVVSHYIGRRASICVGCAFLNLATILTMVVNTIGGAYAARFLVGVAQGFLYTFFNLYLQVRSRIPSDNVTRTDNSPRNVHRLGIVASCCQYLEVF